MNPYRESLAAGQMNGIGGIDPRSIAATPQEELRRRAIEQAPLMRNTNAPTQEEKRMLIAKACGWNDIRRPCDDNYHEIPTDTLGFIMGRVAGIAPGKVGVENHRPLPDYFNDLNACHEMEKVLTEDQRWKYSAYIVQSTGFDRSNDPVFPAAHAISAQRAEAFGKTLNLW